MSIQNSFEDKLRHPERWVGLTGSRIGQHFGQASSYMSMWLSEPGLELELSKQLAQRYNQNYSAYDRVIDSVYNSTHIGGSIAHHNLDGQHTFVGAMNALRDAFPHDSSFVLFGHELEHFARDLTTPSGINPFLNPHDFASAKALLVTDFGVTPGQAQDLLNLNAVELAGAIVGTASIVFALSSKQEQDLGCYAGRIGLVGCISNNPALFAISLATAAIVGVRMWQGKSDIVTLGGFVDGGVSAVTFFTAAGVVAGPAILGVLIGTAASIGVSAILKNACPDMFTKVEDTFRATFPNLRVGYGL